MPSNKPGPNSGIACPGCGHRSAEVTDSRPNPIGIRRRRRCQACSHGFTTIEIVVDPVQPTIITAGWTTRPRSERLGDFMARFEGMIHTSVTETFQRVIRREETVELVEEKD